MDLNGCHRYSVWHVLLIFVCHITFQHTKSRPCIGIFMCRYCDRMIKETNSRNSTEDHIFIYYVIKKATPMIASI